MDQKVGPYIEDGRAKRERIGVPGSCGAAVHCYEKNQLFLV